MFCYADDEDEDGKSLLDTLVEIIIPDCTLGFSKKKSRSRRNIDDESFTSLDSSGKKKARGLKRILPKRKSEKRIGNVKLSNFSRG